jgi:hypothetical protein
MSQKQTLLSGSTTDHIHYYIFDTPNGPVATGICKVCHAQIHGVNSMPYDRITHRKWLSNNDRPSMAYWIKNK